MFNPFRKKDKQTLESNKEDRYLELISEISKTLPRKERKYFLSYALNSEAKGKLSSKYSKKQLGEFQSILDKNKVQKLKEFHGYQESEKNFAEQTENEENLNGEEDLATFEEEETEDSEEKVEG
ncbi:MAG: hypothetical protein IMZ60_02495 [Actinobacteria bacterium]|nr:hypothetical protein [Actinomycetota bacterium]